METSFGRQSVSAAVVMCMLMTSVAVLFSAFALGGTIYPAPVSHVDGNEQYANLGRSVAIMDIDGDHIGDIIIGVPYASVGGLSAAGAVRVYLSSGGMAMADPPLVINGTNAGDRFGWCVANVSDVNNDGWSDLAISAPFADVGALVDAGNVSVFYGGWSGFDGKPNVTISGAIAGEMFGCSIAAAGDIMVDEMDDIIVGSPYYTSGTATETGRVDIFYGGDPMNSIPDRTYTGNTAWEHFGWAVAGGVNIDQDVTPDMVVGAPGVQSMGMTGSAYIYRNLDRVNPTLNVVTGDAVDDEFGASVALMEDLNSDTFGEVVIGAPFNDENGTNAGSVSIILGASKFKPVVGRTLVGSQTERFGYSLASGDILEDGYSDLLVGAPESRLNSTFIGHAYAYYGGSAWTEPNLTLVPDADTNYFGGCVAIGDNFTGDSAQDFAISDQFFDLVLPGPITLPNVGRVYVYAGVKLTVPHVPENPVVQGHVYVPGTTIGLQGFTVTLESPDADPKSTTTNAAGAYKIDAVPATYWLNASKGGYVQNSTTITLAMDETKTVDFYPKKVPVVTGVVSDDPLTKLMEGAKVALYNWTTFISATTTPANGTYWLQLPVEYIPPDGANVTLTVKAWDMTHYTQSSNFTIERNETIPVNFALDRFPVVSGTLRDALDFSTVRGMVTANQGPTILATANTDVRGAYTLVAVNASEPARLYLNASATGYYRFPDWVDVEKNKTYSLDFLLQRDNTKPTSQLDALGEYTATAIVSLSATADDPNGVKEVQLWYRNSTAASYARYGADASEPYEFSFDSTTTGGDDTYEFYSIAIDWADNAEDAPGTNDTWTTVDSTVPTLTITAPIADQLLPTSTVQVNWTGGDLGSGIASFMTRMDSGSWVDRGTNLSATFTDLAQGNHTVEVNATDKVGRNAVDSVTFSVDSIVPVVLITAPANNSAIASASITLHWSASDNGSGLKTLQVSKDGTLWENLAVNATEFVFYGPSGIAEGAYTLYVRASDYGGLTTTATVNMILDRTEPTVTITFPREGQKLEKSSVSVGWATLDTGSGVSSVRLSIDGGLFTSVASATSYDFTDLDDGTHNVTIRATDRAGNAGEATVEFTISTGGGISSLMIGAIAVIVIVIVAVVVAMLLMKRKKEPMPEKKGPKK